MGRAIDPEVLEDAFRQHPKALILCNPSNPCVKVFTRAELELIASLAKKYDVYVITDEVYEHIVYAPHIHTYFATLLICGSGRSGPCPQCAPGRILCNDGHFRVWLRQRLEVLRGFGRQGWRRRGAGVELLP